MSKITIEQEEHLRKMIQINETKTNYVCVKCKKRFIGLIKVREHVDEKNHYEFKSLRSCGSIMFL